MNFLSEHAKHYFAIIGRNQECLVANFIAKYPDVPIEEIEFVVQKEGFETTYSVRRKQR